jgi:hypothetical protein
MSLQLDCGAFAQVKPGSSVLIKMTSRHCARVSKGTFAHLSAQMKPNVPPACWSHVY